MAIPLEISAGDFSGTITAGALNTGTHTLRVWVQDSDANVVEQRITFRYQVPLLTAGFTAPVTSGVVFDILQPEVELTGRVTASAAFPLVSLRKFQHIICAKSLMRALL